MSIEIRIANKGDAEVLTEFNCRLARETESIELNRATVLSGVQRGLAVTGEVIYFVAEDESDVVGQLMLTREWSDWRDGWLAWLQSVYVRSDYRQQGVFRCLLDAARKHLRGQPDVVGLRLYVEDENTSAMSTYTRLGFKDAGYRVMEHLFDA